VTAQDLPPGDREHLNLHIRDIVGKVAFGPGRFIGEVQPALSKLRSAPCSK